jgi:hypothetical protein
MWLNESSISSGFFLCKFRIIEVIDVEQKNFGLTSSYQDYNALIVVFERPNAVI